MEPNHAGGGYTVQALAVLAGVSCRTLRYYDALGLLTPARQAENGYRLYGPTEVDRLQQILFYRALGVPLKEISPLLNAPPATREKTLRRQLTALHAEQQRLAALERNLTKTIQAMKGEITMTDTEKFEGFKKEMIDKNEETYGDEVRRKYGSRAADAVNARVKGMSEAQWQKAESLRRELETRLKALVPENDPTCPAAAELCELHKQWLCCYWTPEMYTREAHAALGQGYVADARFKAYYDAILPGAAEYLCAALQSWCRGNTA